MNPAATGKAGLGKAGLGGHAAGDAPAKHVALPREHGRWLAALARRAPAAMAVAVSAPLLAGLLLLAQAWLLAQVLHRAIADEAAVATLWPSIAALAALMGVRALLVWAGERAGSRAAEHIKAQVRCALFGALLARGPRWTRERPSGELASMLAEQVEALDGFFARYLPAMIAGSFLPLAFSLALLPVDVVVALVLLLTAPMIPLFMALVGWGAEAAHRSHMQTFARLSGYFADRVRGLATLRLFGRAQAESQAVREASEQVAQKTLSVLRIAFLSSAVLEFFAALGVAGVALYVGLSYLGFLDLRADPLTLQAGLFCLLMAPEVYAPLRQFAAHYHDRAAARAAVAQVAQTFGGLEGIDAAAPAAVAVEADGSDAVPARREALSLSVEGLTLSVPGRDMAIIARAAFALAPGEHVALTGPSGIGKSTLLEAVAGLGRLHPEVRVGGIAQADWPRGLLRERIALVTQRPYLHAGTIAENLRLARPGASDEALMDAVEQAQMLDFLAGLPRGLDTLLGPRGYGLSGGQAQRVALARLFLSDPGLVLLDEPTAHLDGATRDALLDAILAFCRGRTLLAVTHDDAVLGRFGRRLRVGPQGEVRE